MILLFENTRRAEVGSLWQFYNKKQFVFVVTTVEYRGDGRTAVYLKSTFGNETGSFWADAKTGVCTSKSWNPYVATV